MGVWPLGPPPSEWGAENSSGLTCTLFSWLVGVQQTFTSYPVHGTTPLKENWQTMKLPTTIPSLWDEQRWSPMPLFTILGYHIYSLYLWWPLSDGCIVPMFNSPYSGCNTQAPHGFNGGSFTAKIWTVQYARISEALHPQSRPILQFL